MRRQILRFLLFFKSLNEKVADDPETLRIKQNTKHFSNVEYHGDLAKKAAMEKQREVTEVADNRGNNYYFIYMSLHLYIYYTIQNCCFLFTNIIFYFVFT